MKPNESKTKNYEKPSRFANELSFLHDSKSFNESHQEITPELAAHVVKEYLLPMFEASGKKHHLVKKQKTQI